MNGRATGQAVIRRLPAAAARVRPQVRSCGICDGHKGTGAGVLRVLRFLLPSLIPRSDEHPHYTFISFSFTSNMCNIYTECTRIC
jgi:hypothetical protein